LIYQIETLSALRPSIRKIALIKALNLL